MAEATSAIATATTAPFLTLPWELRDQILTDAILNNLPRPQRRPEEPAITRVCRLLRAEGLPIYYAAYPLTIQTAVWCDVRGGEVCMSTDRWYRQLSADKLGAVRTLLLDFSFGEAYGGDPSRIEITVQMDRRGGRYARVLALVRPRCGLEACAEIMKLRAHLESVLSGLKGAQVSVEDIDRLVSVDAESLRIR